MLEQKRNLLKYINEPIIGDIYGLISTINSGMTSEEIVIILSNILNIVEKKQYNEKEAFEPNSIHVILGLINESNNEEIILHSLYIISDFFLPNWPKKDSFFENHDILKQIFIPHIMNNDKNIVPLFGIATGISSLSENARNTVFEYFIWDINVYDSSKSDIEVLMGSYYLVGMSKYPLENSISINIIAKLSDIIPSINDSSALYNVLYSVYQILSNNEGSIEFLFNETNLLEQMSQMIQKKNPYLSKIVLGILGKLVDVNTEALSYFRVSDITFYLQSGVKSDDSIECLSLACYIVSIGLESFPFIFSKRLIDDSILKELRGILKGANYRTRLYGCQLGKAIIQYSVKSLQYAFVVMHFTEDYFSLLYSDEPEYVKTGIETLEIIAHFASNWGILDVFINDIEDMNYLFSFTVHSEEAISISANVIYNLVNGSEPE